MSEQSWEHVVQPPGRPVIGSLRDILMPGMSEEERSRFGQNIRTEFTKIRESERLAEINGDRIISPDEIEEKK